jgi:NADPH-dependent 2,4-dienoyl-CoA reductase/sulfur reductase-like enzyme
MLPMSVPRGAFVHLAEAMKTVIDIPVMTGGRINDIRFANDIIKEGRADLVHMGRAFLSDAHFIPKAMEGDFDDIRLCIGCVNCFDRAGRGRPIACAVNPEMGFESKKLGKAEVPKNVLIVGGGPSGMEAARVASGIRGHTVTLWEKNANLGGNLSLSSIAPHKEEMRTYYDYLINQMNRHEVDIVLNKNATADEIISLNPDVVVIATGASIDTPSIPGIDKKKVVNGLDVLNGKVETGSSVIVLGGGMIGCEVSEFLVSRGKDVSMVEMEKKIARDVGPAMKWDVVRRIKRWGINLLLSSKAVEITDDGVVIEDKVGTKTVNADTVVYALGMKPNNELYNELSGKIPNLHQIGDCVKPAHLLEAVHSGYNINRRF